MLKYNLIFDYYFTFFNPIIWTSGVLINLFASRIWFSIRKKEKSNLYTYLFVSSSLYTFSSSCNTLLSLKFCGSLCSTSGTIWAQYIQLIVQNFIIQFVFNFQMFNLLCSTFTTFASLNNKLKRFTKVNPLVGLSISSFFGVTIAVVQVLSFEVRPKESNETLNMTSHEFVLKANSLGSNIDYFLFTLYLKGIYYFFPLALLIFINVLMLVQLRRLMQEKKKLLKLSVHEVEKKTKEMERNQLVMMLFISLIFGTARLYDVFVVYAAVHIRDVYPLFLTFGFFVSGTSMVCHSIVYFKVNEIFKAEAKSFLRAISQKLCFKNKISS